MSIYRNEEDYYVGTRECPQCKDQFTVDVTLYKEIEYWTCPKCKTEQKRSISCQANLWTVMLFVRPAVITTITQYVEAG